MRFDPWKCPECGDAAKGTLETVPGLALLIIDPDGAADYAGETEMDWDGQRTILDNEGRATLQCPSGHQWQASVREEPDPPTEEQDNEP